MSEARAGHLPYTGTPDVAPSFAPAEYQRIQATPEEFGAQVGQGLEVLGQGLRQASDVYSDIAAQQATTNWRKQVNGILFGDPNKPGDVGYYGLQGQAAMDARQGVVQAIDDATQQHLGTMTTARSQMLFNNEARFYQDRVNGEIGRHYAEQSKIWGEQINNAQYANAIAEAGLRPEDPDAANHALATANEARVKRDQILGLLPMDLSKATDDQLEIFHRDTRQSSIDVLESRIHSLIGQNKPDAASALFQENQGLLSESKNFDALSAKVNNENDAAVGRRLGMGTGIHVGGVAGGGGQNNPGNIRVPGSAGTSPSAFQSFETPEAGIAAIGRNIDAYQDQHGINTLRGIISRWAPPNENDTSRLVTQGAHLSGLDPDQPINVHDPETRLQVMTAIVGNEHGGAVPNPEVIQKVASWPQSGGGVPLPAGADIAPAVQNISQTAPSLLQTPGLYDRLVQIENSNATPKQKNIGAEVATRLYSAKWAQDSHNYERYTQAINKASDAREKAITADITSGNSQISISGYRA